jgi:AraC family transcriptional regulator
MSTERPAEPAIERFATMSVAGLTADYTRLPPGTGPSITAGHAIGVAFTPQRRAAWLVGRGEPRVGPLAPGTVFVAPAEGLEWTEWSDASESVEMWLDPRLLSELSQLAGGPSPVRFEYHEVRSDPVVVNLASLVRESLISGDGGGARLESAAIFLAGHVLERYHGLHLPPSGRIRKLDRAVLARVADYVDAYLQRSVGLFELARIAGQSPYHFAKAFKATTGSAPHAYLAARRMERALVLLQQSRHPVSRIARLVGFESLSHFRRRFQRAWGESTAVYRSAGRPRRAA